VFGEPAGIGAGERGRHIGDVARRAQAAQRVSRMTCFSALAGWGLGPSSLPGVPAAGSDGDRYGSPLLSRRCGSRVSD